MSLSYSWSRINRRIGRRDISVYTTQEGTWVEFVELMQPLAKSEHDPKTDPGYITAALIGNRNDVCDKDGGYKYAAGGMNYRCNANVVSSSLAYADIDHATQEEFEADCDLVANSRYQMMLYTTASHKPDAPRYRVVMPVDEAVTDGDIIRIRLGLVQNILKGREVDSAGFTLSQPMYRPPAGSTVIISRGRRAIPPHHLMKDIVEVSVSSASDYVLPEGETNALKLLLAEYADEFGGRLDARGLKMPASDEHAWNYTSESKPDDFLFCWGRDGYERPNVGMYHDTDIAACDGMNSGGREVWEYAFEACGLPWDARIETALGWKTSANDFDPLELEDDDLPEMTRADYVVEGYLPTDCIWSLVGESGTYKSFYVLGLMYISAAGYRFAGADTQRAHHFYIDGEGGAYTQTRIDALAAQYGDEGRDYVHVLDADEYRDKEKLVRKIRRIAGSEAIGSVVFDTLNQTFGISIEKFDENSSSTAIGMGRVIAEMKDIKKHTGAAVGVVQHTPKGGSKARGSGALYGGVDVELTLTRATDGRINVVQSKNKHGFQQKTVGMVLESVQFREEPPAKVYTAKEFPGGAGYGDKLDLERPEPHKSLVLQPWGFVPFETDEEREKREAAEEKSGGKKKSGGESSPENSVLAAVNELSANDETGAFFPTDVIIGAANDERVTVNTLKRMRRKGDLIQGDEPGYYRLPDRINDRKNSNERVRERRQRDVREELEDE